MAKASRKKNAPAAVENETVTAGFTPVPPRLDDPLTLGQIVEASNMAPGYTFGALTDNVLQMEAAGLIEINRQLESASSPGHYAVRATEQGKARHMENAALNTTQGDEVSGGAAGNTETVTTAAEVASSGSGFAIARIPIPTPKRSTEYPFDDLKAPENGQADAFFIPATTDRPDPAKSLASTVSSAGARYREQIGVETRNGKEVAKYRYNRKFVIQPGNGPKGEKGAWVARIK